MQIGVIGTGYVGLVTGVMLTTLDHKVTCIDIDHEKVEKLKNGDCIIYEKDLHKFLNNALHEKKINFSTSFSDLSNSEAVFVCVGTPPKNDGRADLSFVENAVISIAKINPEALIIIKSTVPPGSAKYLQKILAENGYSNKIASNPEFLREGEAVYDFISPDRIVIGSNSDEGTKILQKIYEKKENEGIALVVTDTNTSEMIKYTSNSFLSIKLSFINEMSNLCEQIGADVKDLSYGVGLDKRIGKLFLNPGPGFGGSCFPKDTSALSMLANDMGCPSMVLDAAIESNLMRYGLMKNKITEIAKDRKRLAILGAAFKGGTDDIRESPAVNIIKLLSAEGYILNVYDPAALKNLENLNIKNVVVQNNIENAMEASDLLVLLTEWQEFKEIDFSKLINKMSTNIIIDLRRILNEKELTSYGFDYYTIGK